MSKVNGAVADVFLTAMICVPFLFNDGLIKRHIVDLAARLISAIFCVVS